VRPVEARNRGDKTKSKAIPGGFTTPFKSIKTLEHVCVFDGRNSWPIIGNGNCGSAVTALCDLNNYLSGCATMFECIVYEIGNGIENEISIAASYKSTISVIILAMFTVRNAIF